MTSTLIICLGNPLMADEGIGTRVAVELSRNLEGAEGVEVHDMGTGGFAVLHMIAGREKVIFVDCAFMGLAPGAIKRFLPEEAISQKVGTRQSLHEGDLFNTLELSRQMGECPHEVVIFGIQPKVVEDGQELSRELEERIEDYVDEVLKECEKSA